MPLIHLLPPLPPPQLATVPLPADALVPPTVDARALLAHVKDLVLALLAKPTADARLPKPLPLHAIVPLPADALVPPTVDARALLAHVKDLVLALLTKTTADARLPKSRPLLLASVVVNQPNLVAAVNRCFI